MIKNTRIMNKNIFSFLFSTRLMALLFIVYAAAMAAGTFIESAYNTDTARIWIYNAWWFEVIHVFFLINFFGNIKRYQLHKKKNGQRCSCIWLLFLFLSEQELPVISVMKVLCLFKKGNLQSNFILIKVS